MSAVLKRFSSLTVLLAVVLAFAVGSLVLAGTANAAVVPAKVKVSSVTSSAPGKVQVVAKKVKDAKGYQYQVSQKRTFKGKSTLTKKIKKTKAVFSGLSQGKRYYVRARAYKGSKYGKWSAVKSVVVRKAASSSSNGGKSSSTSSGKSSSSSGSKSSSSSSASPGGGSSGSKSSGSSGSSSGSISGSSSSASSGGGSSGTSSSSGLGENELEMIAVPDGASGQ